MKIRSLTVISLLCALGCGNSQSASEAPAASAQAATAAAPAAAPKPAEPPKPVIEETAFRLALEGTVPYSAGQPGQLKLVLDPRGGYHVNQDYPTRIDLKVPATVKLAKPSLGKADAASFGEKNAAWNVDFTADKGEHSLVAAVDFAVCTADTCMPEQRTIAIALNVQ
jgi:hypothetical protein